MNDQQILEFIAVKQPVRAVQLADKFDVDLKSASDALKSLVDVGDLVRTAGTAPNQQPAQFYSLSSTFLTSRDGKLLVARMEAQASAVAQPSTVTLPLRVPPSTAVVALNPVTLPPPAAVVATPSPAPSPVLSIAPPGAAQSPADDISLRRIDRAIAHITANGPTSDADIRVVLNLRADQYPTNFIGRAVKDGRLAKDGRLWTLGTGTPAAPIKRQPAFGGALGLAGATPFPVAAKPPSTTPMPTARTDHHQEQTMQANDTTAKAAPAGTDITAKPPTFRCGLWSDGVLEMQRDGVQVAELSQEEGETVAAFMARMREQLQAA
jgi:hypothetical protein